MANYYTDFSFVMQLSNEEEVDAALELWAKINNAAQETSYAHDTPLASLAEELNVPIEFTPFIKDSNFGFELESQLGYRLWFNTKDIDGTGNPRAAAEFVHYLLKAYQPAGFVYFEWANTCSRPVQGAFSGGAAIATAKNIHYDNSLIKKLETCREKLKDLTVIY